jgi:hypothetical protein
MPVERGGVKLRQNVNALDLRVDTITDGNIDQTILGPQRDRWLGAKFGERIKPSPRSTA